MWIEAGKYYRDECGDKIGPLKPNPRMVPGEYEPWPWTDGKLFWNNSGKGYRLGENDWSLDLVAEWSELPAAPLAEPPTIDRDTIATAALVAILLASARTYGVDFPNNNLAAARASYALADAMLVARAEVQP